MTKVATESIQFPYNQGVIWPQGLQTGNKSRAIFSLARCMQPVPEKVVLLNQSERQKFTLQHCLT
jgi:hypothetical protein